MFPSFLSYILFPPTDSLKSKRVSVVKRLVASEVMEDGGSESRKLAEVSEADGSREMNIQTSIPRLRRLILNIIFNLFNQVTTL